MPSKVFTGLFFASFAGCLVGATIASGPLIWSIMRHDLDQSQVLTNEIVPVLFGLFEFNYITIVKIIDELLMAGIAMGVAGSLGYYESRLDGQPLGIWAGFFFWLCLLGSLVLLFIFIGIARANLDANAINVELIKYLIISCNIFLGLVLSYFACIVQIRRVKDLGILNG